MYIDYQILSVVEDMSANPQSKFDGMNCTPIALGRYDDCLLYTSDAADEL